MMDSQTTDNFTVSATSSALILSWTLLDTNQRYLVECNSSESLPPCAQSSSHHISIHACNFTNHVEVRYLVPGLHYTCCISEEFNSTQISCKDSLMLAPGLSAPLVGVIGGAIGAIVAALIIMVIIGIICGLCKTCRLV